jgi:sigma-B regulation protein RsbU (phosphoserine phosphatase)
LAALFAAATILYSGLWIYSERWQVPVQLGFDTHYVEAEHSQPLTNIYKDSPAEKAGLQAGDRILKVDGERFESDYSLNDIWARHKPGDTVELTIQRPHVPAPFTVRATFRAVHSQPGKLTEHLSQDIINVYPVVFLVVGLSVLFLRVEDPYVWLLALDFAGTISIANWSSNFAGLGPTLRRLVMAYRAIFNGFDSAFFFLFFAVFPARSPLDRRAPWLKWLGLALGPCFALPGLGTGFYQTPAVVGRLFGQVVSRAVRMVYAYGFHILGLVSLVGNAVGASTPEVRRRSRVIVWGTLVGVVPVLLGLGAQELFGFTMSLWLTAVLVLLLCLYPLSFAYAVVKHRVLEIPVLLRRSARYLLVQRGFVFLHLLVSVVATVLFAWGLSRTRLATPVGLTGGVIFGSVLALGGLRVHRTTSQRIDRAFFRSAYDARMILEDLVEKTRTATNRNELAALLEHHLTRALHPVSFAAYLETSDNQLSAVRGNVPPELQTISGTQPLMADLARRGRPWEVSEESLSDAPGLFLLAPLHPDCLVPILGRDSRPVGLLVLGPRLSEEPYSREDKQLLASVASQAGVALESIRLGEKIAERIEAERRAAQEMEFAREVQARLFPQKLPPLKTLEYTGTCIQARQVGGDYYDFLELRPGRLALVLADIAGKGVSGALLMANLQANLRSQYAMALDDLPRLLKSVNQLFYDNTTEGSYATLFFGDYDDSTRRLRYANCGHLPPLLLRASGPPPGGPRDRKMDGSSGPQGGSSQDQAPEAPQVELLRSTCTVVGLFEEWQYEIAEVGLAPGDTLVLYTDGVTEAASAAGEEFGECRLLDTLLSRSQLPVGQLLEAIIEGVQQFSGGEQQDDITLVIARSVDR